MIQEEKTVSIISYVQRQWVAYGFCSPCTAIAIQTRAHMSLASSTHIVIEKGRKRARRPFSTNVVVEQRKWSEAKKRKDEKKMRIKPKQKITRVRENFVLCVIHGYTWTCMCPFSLYYIIKLNGYVTFRWHINSKYSNLRLHLVYWFSSYFFSLLLLSFFSFWVFFFVFFLFTSLFSVLYLLTTFLRKLFVSSHSKVIFMFSFRDFFLYRQKKQ